MEQLRLENVPTGKSKEKYTKKEEAASLSVCLDSIFITAAIEAREERDVSTNWRVNV